MRRRHLAATAALSVLLAVPAAANAQTTSTVKVTAKSSVVAGTTMNVAVRAIVPPGLRRARQCTVAIAGATPRITTRIGLGVLGRTKKRPLRVPLSVKPGSYRLVAACSGIKRTQQRLRVLPPPVAVNATLLGGPVLQGTVGTTAFAWAVQVTNPSRVLDAYSVTVTVALSGPAGQPVIDRQLIRRIPAGATVTVGANVPLQAGSAPLTTAQVSAAARFGLVADGPALPIVTPNPLNLSQVIVSGVVTTVSVDGAQVASASRGIVTRRRWFTFFDRDGKFVGAAAEPRGALPPGASPLNFQLTGITVPQGAVTARVSYEG